MNHTLELRLPQVPPAQLRRALAEQLAATSVQHSVQKPHDVRIRILDAAGEPFVGAGIADLPPIDVIGTVGDYALCGIDNGDCTIEGDAGKYLGHSMRSGVIVCKGSASDAVGAMGVGGLIAVYGTAGDRVGVSLRGSDIVVRGNVGLAAGYRMRQGTLVLGGNAGAGLGEGMQGGTIYLRGDAASISDNVEEHRLREPDRLKLGLLLLKAGIKSNAGREFRVFRAKSESES